MIRYDIYDERNKSYVASCNNLQDANKIAAALDLGLYSTKISEGHIDFQKAYTAFISDNNHYTFEDFNKWRNLHSGSLIIDHTNQTIIDTYHECLKNRDFDTLVKLFKHLSNAYELD